MTLEVFNFSAGPAILPRPVLERAQAELCSFRDLGISVMEMSHRSKEFGEVLHSAESGIRSLLGVPQNYRILFMQGGATLQFSMVPMNFLPVGASADYVLTGAWGRKAAAAAKISGRISEMNVWDEAGFPRAPEPGELKFDQNARYVHYTSNETIDGVEFGYDLDGGSIPVVCDSSSNIMSRAIDIEKYSLIYAGAQKNIGPSGVTVVIVRDDMLERCQTGLHPLLDYRQVVEHDSMLNTPNTWGIYLIGLVCDWLAAEGGVEVMAERNREKAALLYDAIDSSDGFYVGLAGKGSRSLMNVTFRLQGNLPENDLENRFVTEAESAGLIGLKGHRSVGGIRASIYNAFPRRGVEVLVEFMQDFASRNG